MLSAHKLSKHFGHNKIISNLSFELKASDKLLISGANGCGKSTLAKILVGVLSQDSGAIQCEASMGWMPAQSESFFPELTGIENLYAFASFNNATKLDVERSIGEHSKILSDDILNSRFKSFSSGMRQKLNFVRALLHRPDLLILDEPLAHLDDESRTYVISFLANYHGGVLLMSHFQELWKSSNFTHLEFGALNAS
tara:strand:- start:72762 stop:73352 length:591 start_codon:yes stop_codon:yes gene_type:complete